jgi:hypothetical protein
MTLEASKEAKQASADRKQFATCTDNVGAEKGKTGQAAGKI